MRRARIQELSLLLIAAFWACEGDTPADEAAALPTASSALTAWAGAGVHVRVGEVVTFHAHFTGKVERVEWDFDDDEKVDITLELARGSLETTSHTYTVPGQYLAVMKVVDDVGQVAEAHRRVTVYRGDEDVVLGRFGPWFELPGQQQAPAVAAHDLDPARAANLARYPSLTAREKGLLKQHGFAVRPTTRAQMHGVYADALQRQQALFISVDAMLHAQRALLGAARQRIEAAHLRPTLRTLLDALLAGTNAQLARAGTPAVKRLLEQNLAYLLVASSLLGRVYKAPASVQATVAAELALIKAHRGHAVSPLFGTKEDYSAYRPRGHDDAGEGARRYFRVMTWLGRTVFRFSPPSEEGGATQGRDETLQAMLLTQALHTTPAGKEPASALWVRVHEAAAFLSGRAEDVTPRDLARLMDKVYGPTWRALTPAALAEPARVGIVIDQARKLRDLQSSTFAWQVHQASQLPVQRGVRFMGRSVVPDDYVLQQLVHPRVGVDGKGNRRTLPRGLDVMAVLGSQRAADVLDKVYKATSYTGYAGQVVQLRSALATATPHDRVQTVPWAWLHALTPLMAAPGAGHPSFMRGVEWRDKQLNAALGGWTALRHSAAPRASTSKPPVSTSPTVPLVYVEPAPRVYARLFGLVRMTRLGLEARGLEDATLRKAMLSLETTLSLLQQYALRELAGEDLTAPQMDTLRDFGEQLRGWTEVDSGRGRPRMAHVVTIGVDAAGQARQDAVGDPMDLLVVVARGGETLIARGAVHSYYELTRSAGAVLNDDSWQRLLAGSQAPTRPAWIFP